MSLLTTNMSTQEMSAILRELFANEKAETRMWLRAEMDALVDPLVDSIFDRLEIKLTNRLEQNQVGAGYLAQVINPFGQVESANQPVISFIAQPSTFHISSLNPTSFYFDPQSVQFTSPTFQIQASPVSMTNEQINLSNQITNVEATNENILPKTVEDKFTQFCEPIDVDKHSNQNLANLDDEEEEVVEEECERVDCVNGIEGTRNENDGDSVDWFEVSNIEVEVSSQPIKKPRLEISYSTEAQPEINQESSKQLTKPNQMDNQSKQFITISLECFKCSEKFYGVYALLQLNDHLWQSHSIRPFRCPVKDCGQSFENAHFLSDHIRQAHKRTTQWDCDKCSSYFNKYSLLSVHNTEYHYLGQFQCSFPECTFTGKHRRKIYDHYTREHKPTLTSQSTSNSNQTRQKHSKKPPKTHKRAPLDGQIRSYRCKWAECDYATTSQSDTIDHIARMHFAFNTSLIFRQLREPKDYVEVVYERLKSNNQQPTRQRNQMSDKEKKFITVSLQCPGCTETFSEDNMVEKLNNHLWHRHSIDQFSCLVKDCDGSFENKSFLADHITQIHKNTTQWDCGKCAGKFATYSALSVHNNYHHQKGQFKCTFPLCTFIGDYKRNLYNHYSKQHRPKLNSQLYHFGTLNSACNLVAHTQTLPGDKLYRSTLAGCNYAATQKSNVIGHIRNVHFAPNPSSALYGTPPIGEPKDYVEVVHV